MSSEPGRGRDVHGRWWLVGLLIAVAVVGVLAPLASADPDGLERVAIDEGFADRGRDAPFAIIPDYAIPGIDGSLSTVLAGTLGVLVVFALAWVIGRALARRSQEG